jgi:serine/threonine protein kinase/Flp pilus assembly protein TadD
MTPERYQQIGEIYHSALELGPKQRLAFLAQACAGDEELLREVKSLIASNEQAGEFIHAPALEVAAELLTTDQCDLLPGKSLGPYTILELLGSGGMGEVYLAQDSRLGRRVALKLLPDHFVTNEDRLRRFRQEARAASALNHPNIITIHEIDEAETTHYIVTEFVEGETLRALLIRNRIELVRALDIATQTASALAAAHAAGIVHRDIKPENIMLRGDGYVKVLDFGIAKLMPEGIASMGMSFETSPGLIVGTAHYMSPEQAQGLKVDERTDIWSLGVVLYEMLTGQLPFKGKTLSHTVVSIVEQEVPPLVRGPEVPVNELERILMKALNKNPENRYQTIKDMLVDLRMLQRDLDSGIRVNTTQETARAHTSSVQRFIRVVKPHWLIAMVALAVLLVTVAGIAYFTRSKKKSINSLAILPFINATSDPNTEHLSEGITESLINNLSQAPNLRVMARSTVFSFNGHPDSRKVGSDLGVDAVVTGRVTQLADTLVIQVEIVDVSSGAQIWGERFNRKLTDVVNMQEEISREISEKLHLRMTDEERSRVSKRHTINAEAYQSYLKGRYHWNKRTQEGLKKSIEYFTEALDKDPTYAQAYAGMADSYNTLARFNFLRPQEAYPKARAAVTKALEIDETLAEAHSSLAVVKMDYEWDLPGAEREFKRAIELNPSYPSAHQWYGSLLMSRGQTEEALAETKRAQQLDPLSLIVDMGLGGLYIYARRFDEAIFYLEKVRELHPEAFQPDSNLAYVYEIKGMKDEAVASYLKSRTLAGDTAERIAALKAAYAVSGWKGYLQKRVDEMKEHARLERYISPFSVALLYLLMGEKNQALAWLEKTYEERNYRLLFIKVDARLDGLRSEPRFLDLVRRIDEACQLAQRS